MAAMATVIGRMRIQDSGEGENHSKGVSKKKLQSSCSICISNNGEITLCLC